MPKKKLSLAERKNLLEETKQRQRLQQEARTIKRIEELDIEACERLGRQLQFEHKELNGELECSETEFPPLLTDSNGSYRLSPKQSMRLPKHTV